MRLNVHIINDYIFTFLGAPIMALFSFALTLDQSNISCSHPLDKVMEYTFCSSLAKFFDSSFENFAIHLLKRLTFIRPLENLESRPSSHWQRTTFFSELMKNHHQHPEGGGIFHELLKKLLFFVNGRISSNFSRDSRSQFAV